MPFTPRIAIIGAGPSGLALALLLLQQNQHRNITIYDLRPTPTPAELAKPSGMLDLHEESGLKVMRKCNLYAAFQAAVAEGNCSEACRVLDPQGTVLHTDEGELSTRPEIARNALSGLLIGSVPGSCVRWGTKVVGVREAVDESTGAVEITLDFAGGSTATCDFVVGADGAWSKVRPLLTAVKPLYSGAQFITATLRNASTNFPHLAALVGSGTLGALGGGNGIMTHRGPQDSIRVYAAVSTKEEGWAKAMRFEGKTAAEVRMRLLAEDGVFATWAAELRELLATACDEETKDNPGVPADIWPLYTLPVGHQWTHRAGATLVGDAAHLMTPFAGEGVNLALWDSLDLAHALGGVSETDFEDVASWQKAVGLRVREFEEGMWVRANEKAEESVRMGGMMLSEDGGRKLADMFRAVYGGGGSPEGE